MTEADPKDAQGRGPQSTPEGLRDGVREGILAALDRDAEPTRSGTLARFALAGALGVAVAMGSIVLLSGPTLASDHGLHLALCAAVWSGLLVECFLVVLLRVERRGLPLRHAATLALIGLALAGAIGAVCPHPHFFTWWTQTGVGGAALRFAGESWSAFCLGACTALVIGLGASLLAGLRAITPRSVPLSAALLFLLLWPAVILQSLGVGLAIFLAWTLGLAGGTYLGVSTGSRFDPRMRSPASS